MLQGPTLANAIENVPVIIQYWDENDKLIYFKSPIGKGIIGKSKGDLVEIYTPAGVKNFEIVDVKYI